MSSDLVKVLSSCGITDELAHTLATKYASEHDRIVKEPVAFIQDYWYATAGLGSLMYFYNKDEMKQALTKLSVKPEVVTKIAAAPHNEALFPHRDAIDWASIVIEGQHRRAAGAA